MFIIVVSDNFLPFRQPQSHRRIGDDFSLMKHGALSVLMNFLLFQRLARLTDGSSVYVDE